MPETYVAHHRIEISGTIASGGGVTGEIFSFSLASDDALSDHDLAVAVADPIETWFSSTISAHWAGIPSYCTATQVRVESVNTDGTIASSYAVALDAVGGGLPGTQGNAPLICCFAVTLETDEVSPKGARIRGRFFPPNASYYGLGNPPLSAGDGYGTNIAQSGAWLVTLLNAAGASIIVASQTGGGLNATVTSCSADNVVDTIRRRKNSAVGSRGNQDLPYTP